MLPALSIKTNTPTLLFHQSNVIHVTNSLPSRCHELRLSRGMNVTSTFNQDTHTNSLVLSVKCYTCHELSTIQMSRTPSVKCHQLYHPHITPSFKYHQLYYIHVTNSLPSRCHSIIQISRTPSVKCHQPYHLHITLIIRISQSLLYKCHEISTIHMSLKYHEP